MKLIRRMFACFLLSSLYCSLASTSTLYEHLNVQQQLARYRKVYDEIKHFYDFDRASPPKYELFEKLHVPGLLAILSDGFALVFDILSKRNLDVETENRAFMQLKKLDEKALELHENQQMTQANFITLNLALAYLTDRYKPNFSINKAQLLRDSGNSINDLDDALDKANVKQFDVATDKPWWVEKIVLPFENERKPLSQVGNLKTMNTVYHQQFAPPAIIYGKPTLSSKKPTQIAPSTFVDQVVNYDYRLNLILFDAESALFPKSEKPKKSEGPHFSRWNGTYNLLSHDILHSVEQFYVENLIERALPEDKRSANISYWRSQLQKINNIRIKKKEENKNEYIILTNGLFILSHELYNITTTKNRSALAMLSLTGSDSDWNNMISIIKHEMTSKAKGSARDLYYKIAQRDHEFILRSAYDSVGLPLYPAKEDFHQLTVEQKQDAVSNGYERFWSYFLTMILNNR